VKYRWLGNSGLRVSILSLGTSPFGSRMGSVSGVDQETASRIVARAIDGGVNLFDTADEYSRGQAEEILGKALGKKRDDVLIATKAGYRAGDDLNDFGSSRRHLTLALEGSLRRLQRDYVDLFYVHVFDPHTSAYDLLVTLDCFVKAGKVRAVAASNYPAWRLVEALNTAGQSGFPRFCAYQGLWNILSRDVELEIVPACLANGLGFIAWAPLAGGWLTGKYSRNGPLPCGARLTDPADDDLHLDREMGYQVVDTLTEIARVRGATVSQIALSWQFARPWLCSSVAGARTVEQLEENLAAESLELSNEELARIDHVAPVQRVWPHWFIDEYGED